VSQFLHDDYDYWYVSVSKLSTWQDQSHISVTITVQLQHTLGFPANFARVTQGYVTPS